MVNRALDPATREVLERRRLLGLSQPVLSMLASVPPYALAKAERGLGRSLRPDELERLRLVLQRLESVRLEAAGLALRTA
jgi:hypothetical protein